MTYQVEAFDAESVYFNGAVDIYIEFTGHDVTESRQFFKKYATTKPDYVGLVAVQDEQVIGMAFGTRSAMGDWWHNRVAQEVGPHHRSLQDAWVLIELIVRAGYRDRGIGAQLHDAVIARQPYRNLLLSTGADNTGAQRFYRRRGWRYLHHGFPFRVGRPPYVIMSRQLT